MNNPQSEKPAVPAVRRFRNTPRGLAEYEHGEWIGYIHYEDLKAQLTALEAENQELVKEANHDIKALEAENQKLREAIRTAIHCGEHVVKLIEAVGNAGVSQSPTERADWQGAALEAYAAMSFLNEARAALSNAGEGKEKGK